MASITEGLNFGGTLSSGSQHVARQQAKLPGRFRQDVESAGREAQGSLGLAMRYGWPKEEAAFYPKGVVDGKAAPSGSPPEQPAAPAEQPVVGQQVAPAQVDPNQTAGRSINILNTEGLG